MNKVSPLLRSIYKDYQKDVGLDANARYLYGTPIRPVVPLDTGIGGVFILGAYPSARFESINGFNDVPVADNLGPFENERWFDGTRVRQQASAMELERLFLNPLGLIRSSCWITDLVKVFLFKRGHRKKYAALGAASPAGYERERFYELGCRSISWLEREIRVAKPQLMITLGREVAGILNGVDSARAQNNLLRAELKIINVGQTKVPTVHCPHPGILMRPGTRNPWPNMYRRSFLPVLREIIQ